MQRKRADRLQLVPADKDAASGNRPDLEAPGEGTDAEEGGSPAPGGRNDLAAGATSVRHMFCHEFHNRHNPYCQACVESKMRRAKYMRRGCAEARRAKKTTFGELITAGHLIRRDDTGCPDYEPGKDVLERAQNALVISDSCPEFFWAHPQETESKGEAKRILPASPRQQRHSTSVLRQCWRICRVRPGYGVKCGYQHTRRSQIERHCRTHRGARQGRFTHQPPGQRHAAPVMALRWTAFRVRVERHMPRRTQPLC